MKGRILGVYLSKNIIPSASLNFLCDNLVENYIGGVWSFAYGDGTTEPDLTDTALENEIDSFTSLYLTQQGRFLSIRNYLGSEEANGSNIREAGLISAPSAASSGGQSTDVLLARSVLPESIAKTSGISITTIWRFEAIPAADSFFTLYGLGWLLRRAFDPLIEERVYRYAMGTTPLAAFNKQEDEVKAYQIVTNFTSYNVSGATVHIDADFGTGEGNGSTYTFAALLPETTEKFIAIDDGISIAKTVSNSIDADWEITLANLTFSYDRSIHSGAGRDTDASTRSLVIRPGIGAP